MTCPHCAAPVLADAEVCPVCGRTLSPAGDLGQPGPADPTGGWTLPPEHAVPWSAYSAPNPYAASPPEGDSAPAYPPGYPPPGWAPSPPSYPAAGYPPGSPPSAPLRSPVVYPGADPAYHYGTPPPRNSAAFLWSGGGLLLLSLFLCLCMGLVTVGIGQDASYRPADIADSRLGAAICALSVIFVLAVPGLILLIVGVRRRA